VTIDDRTTWDIDDAIWVEEEPAGYRVWVSIADVSKAVAPGSTLDVMARERLGTQYFRTGNSPMLPRTLSERQLSLWPNSPKKTMTIEVVLDAMLQVTEQKLYRSTLVSQARLSYDRIPEILATPANPGHPMMTAAKKLADGLLMKRRANGAMVLYDLNNGWVAGEEGHIRQLLKREDTVGYIVVQEMMILANAAVADYAIKHGIPMLFRTHEGRHEGPNREELLKQIEDALHTPLANLDFIRQRTRQLLEKAKYEGDAKPHFGLNLPAYLHFTSPIRRYADLVVHQQLRAHLKGEPLPYTVEQLRDTGRYITQKILDTQQLRAENMKLKAENKAHEQVERRRIDGLVPKEFERATRVQVRSGADASQAFRDVLLDRFTTDQVPLAAQVNILVNAGETENWQAIKHAIVQHLGRKPENAVSLLGYAHQGYGWPQATYGTKQDGPPHAPVFEVNANIAFDEVLSIEGVRAGTAKAAQQMAAVMLLAKLVQAPVPSFRKGGTPVPPPPAPEKPPFDFTKNPVTALMEWCQTTKNTPPLFTFTQDGPSHMPTITCTVEVAGRTKSCTAQSKQDAKALASAAVIGLLTKPV
jgi:ribonuclease R